MKEGDLLGVLATTASVPTSMTAIITPGVLRYDSNPTPGDIPGVGDNITTTSEELYKLNIRALVYTGKTRFLVHLYVCVL